MPESRPLCVDLDGTLIRTDLLVEMAFAYLRGRPGAIFDLVRWALAGKVRLKSELAARVRIDPATLPYNDALLRFLITERAADRRILLVTASPMAAARVIADHLGVFDDVLATAEGVNLKSAAKRDRLVKLFGRGGFDYVGNAWADLPIWSAARYSLLADPAPGLTPVAKRFATVTSIHRSRPPLWRSFPRAIRAHQWLKNALVFVPLVAASRLFDLSAVGKSFIAFLSMSACASAIYVFNDLLDLPHDRTHPRKRTRPFASGEWPVIGGLALVPALLATSFFIGSFLPWTFLLSLLVYGSTSLLYSWWLKRHELLDVLVLAGLWTVRIFAGGAATGISPSFWLLAFSMFLFMSLALAKRCSELVTVRQSAGLRAHGRDYRIDDLAVLAAMGGGAGCTAVLVLALYIYHPQSGLIYRDPNALMLICPLLLYWISRVWLKTWRGEMSEDPVVFALADKASRWLLVAVGLILLYAK
jgi:4-hydroxybenzoate polyprenyltransferase/phosphoserine phosphatase